MYAASVVFALATLNQLSGGTCFNLSITRNLSSSEELAPDNRIDVEVLEIDLAEDSSDGKIMVMFAIPASFSYSDASVFFANSDKQILEVNLKQTVQGKFYETPYKLIKEMTGETTKKVPDIEFHRVTGSFPRSWLPKNVTKASAALRGSGGEYYNFYKIQNFQISLPDLMVVEEYKNY